MTKVTIFICVASLCYIVGVGIFALVKFIKNKKKSDAEVIEYEQAKDSDTEV